MTQHPSLADFARAWREQPRAGWAHPLSRRRRLRLPRPAIDELIDTVTALQKAEWLEDGVYLGERSFGEAHADLLDAARQLGVSAPPAIVRPTAFRSQSVLGTDPRPVLHLSSYFLRTAPAPERRFLLGSLLGSVAGGTVSADSAYQLLVDDGGLRQLARRSLGPTVEVALAPLSFATRLALSRGHRASVLSNDRAGLLVCGDAEVAGRALLRLALGTQPQVSPQDYLAQLDEQRDGSPGGWTELVSSSPWTHKRLAALDLFARSAAWYRLRRLAPPADALDDEALDAGIDRLLGRPGWTA